MESPQGDNSSSSRSIKPSNDNKDELIKEILGSDSFKDNIFYLKPLLNTIKVIFSGAVDSSGFIKGGASPTQDKAPVQVPEYKDTDDVPFGLITSISYDMFVNCMEGIDVHTITMQMLNITTRYRWDAKLVLALSGFALAFGECRLNSQLYKTNPLAKGVAILKQFPNVMLVDYDGALKPKLDEVFTLIEEILDVTKKIVDFCYDFPLLGYFTTTEEVEAAIESYIPKIVYWTIRSIVVSLTQLLALTNTGIVFLKTEQSESIQKLKDLKGHLLERIEYRNRCMENKKKDGFHDIACILGSSNPDNSESLKIFFNESGHYDCKTKKKVSYNALKREVVALFITDLDSDLTRTAECAILQQVYQQRTRIKSKYEVVWVPINVGNNYNWTRQEFMKFESLRNQMEWHSVDDPSKVDLMGIMYIKEEWKFVEKPLIVVMDTQGKIVHKNGIHMMCIWGSLAYPFTVTREKILWNETVWSIYLLAYNIEQNMDMWIQEGKHVCLYGGEDIKWIQSFTKMCKVVVRKGAISSLEMLYVGRSKLENTVENNITDIIQIEDLSRTLDWNLMRYFWLRLESILYSKQLMEISSSENDPIIQGIRTLLSYDSEQKNWAIISNSKGEMVMANGEDMLKGLHQLFKRKLREKKISFVHAMNEYIVETYSGFGPSNEDGLTKKICGSNSLNSENCTLYVKPLLDIIKLIISYGTNDPFGYAKDFVTHMAAFSENVCEEIPSRMISAIYYEIFDKYSNEVSVHTITMRVLEITKNYNWDAKVVLALASFALTFSEFLLEVQLYETNIISRAIALLKQFPELKLKQKLVDSFFALIVQIFDVTKKIVDFYDLPLHDYFTDESPEIIAASSYIPGAVYRTIRSIVVSLTQVLALTGTDNTVLIITEQSESAQKLKDIKGHLVELIESCDRSIKKEKKDRFQDNMAGILGSSNSDNSKSLKIFLDNAGLYDCYNKKEISYEDLKSKVVALFITDLNSDITCGAECAILQQLHLEKWHNRMTTESEYEVVWLPIMVNNNWTVDDFELFKDLRHQMEWHSVTNPSNVDLKVITFIKEEWNFVEKPLVVVMDAQGKIVNKNAIYMMCIWGSLAYPFTRDREEELWEEMKWSVDLLVDNIELNMDMWIQEGKHICLYGGEDLNWIKRFTKFAKDIASEAAISLELLYVGRSKLKSEMVNIIDIIQKENISRTLDWNLMWYFWVRLESMLYSKGQLMKSNKNEPIMERIHALLSYDTKQENWVIINSSRGEMVLANGEDVLKGLRQLSKQNPRENKIGFVDALDEYIRKTCVVPAALNDYKNTSYMLTATVSKKDYEAFKVVERMLEYTDIRDLKSRGALFHEPYGNRAFYDFFNKKPISSNLRRKIVVLFITDLDPEILYGREYAALQKMYMEKQHKPTRTESQYNVVWMPILANWEKYKAFETLRDGIEWHSMNPFVVPPALINYIQQKWKFSNEPKTLVMDTQCRIVHSDPIHMICIWRNIAYPFSTDREKFLWDKVSWWIDLLLEKLEPNMVNSENYICLYGGEYIEWIREFTTKAKYFANQAGITLELLYVGMINFKKQEIKNNVMTIQKEKLSRTLDWNLISDFWMRLESIQYSRRHVTKSKNVMQGIDLMQSHSSIPSGWALIGRGPGEVVNGIDGAVMIMCLTEYEQWKPRVDEIGFVSALDECYRLFQRMIPVSAPTPRILPDDI